MGILKKLSVLILSLVIFMFATTVSADVAEEKINEKITTEYNSPDILEPPVFDATEVSAGVGAVLEIPAKAAILMDVKTGKILYEQNSHERLAPASITKVMALLLTVESMESGLLSLETMLTASEHACSMGGSQIWLEPGEQMSVDDLLKAAVIGSANDATVVLGEAIAGSEEGFVAMMNERAKELGLKDTTFINATGLDADGHLTSAYDIAVMSMELIKHDIIKNYSTVWMETLRNGQSELVNTNKLVKFYDGCTGLKTGTTSVAGACLSATAERDGLSLVAVVMGAPTSNDRFQGARKLLDFGFATYTSITVTADLSEITEIPVKGGVGSFVIPVCQDEQSFLIEKQRKGELSQTVELHEYLKAPIKKGQQIGVARVFLGTEEIGTVKIISDRSVLKMTYLRAILKMMSSCFKI